MSTAGKAVGLSPTSSSSPSSREPADSRALLGSATSGTPILQMGRLRPSALSWVLASQGAQACSFPLPQAPHSGCARKGWLGGKPGALLFSGEPAEKQGISTGARRSEVRRKAHGTQRQGPKLTQSSLALPEMQREVLPQGRRLIQMTLHPVRCLIL